MRIAIDTGGTFTDCVYLENGTLAVLKVLSTPEDSARSVLDAIRQTTARLAATIQARPQEEAVEVRHGTTIGTNALLERKGARVAFVTTAGFEDSIEIGKTSTTGWQRPSLAWFRRSSDSASGSESVRRVRF